VKRLSAGILPCWQYPNLPSLFSGHDGRRLFEPLLERLKLLTASSGIITAVTSFGGSWYGDRLLASRDDRVIRIEQHPKKLVRIIQQLDRISKDGMSRKELCMRLMEYFNLTSGTVCNYTKWLINTMPVYLPDRKYTVDSSLTMDFD
jgi:hypothetical protein